MNPVNVGLMGLGTVGGGTVKVLTRNAGEIARRAGRGIRITHAAARDYDAGIPGLEQIDKISDDGIGGIGSIELFEVICGFELQHSGLLFFRHKKTRTRRVSAGVRRGAALRQGGVTAPGRSGRSPWTVRRS